MYNRCIWDSAFWDIFIWVGTSLRWKWCILFNNLDTVFSPREGGPQPLSPTSLSQIFQIIPQMEFLVWVVTGEGKNRKVLHYSELMVLKDFLLLASNDMAESLHCMAMIIGLGYVFCLLFFSREESKDLLPYWRHCHCLVTIIINIVCSLDLSDQ